MNYKTLLNCVYTCTSSPRGRWGKEQYGIIFKEIIAKFPSVLQKGTHRLIGQ